MEICGLVCNLRPLPGEIQSWPLYTEVRERLKEKAELSRLVDSKVTLPNKETYIRCCLGLCEMSRSLESFLFLIVY